MGTKEEKRAEAKRTLERVRDTIEEEVLKAIRPTVDAINSHGCIRVTTTTLVTVTMGDIQLISTAGNANVETMAEAIAVITKHNKKFAMAMAMSMMKQKMDDL